MSITRYKFLFTSRQVAGIPVLVSASTSPAAFRRVGRALLLIRRHDPLAFRAITRDLRGGIAILPRLQAMAQFEYNAFCCEIRESYILGWPAEDIAATIVHEATHARLWRAGIRYDEAIRMTVETICMRRECVFYGRLPEGKELKYAAETRLAALDAEYFSDEAFDRRYRAHRIMIMRQAKKTYGVPSWLIQAVASIGRFLKAQ